MPALQGLSGSPKRQNFSMGSGIAIVLAPILPFGNQVSLSINDNGSYGHVSPIACCFCQF
jgi:hypothetical protein